MGPYEFIITRHAVCRFRERIRPLSDLRDRSELIHCLRAAKPKHLRQLKKANNTAIIPTGCCVFIGSKGKVVSVVKQLR